MTDTQTTLRDTISNAFDQVDKPETTEVQPQVTQTETSSDRVRDEKGRFSEKQEKIEVKTDKPSVTTIPEVSKLQRPSSWKKDYWNHWDKLTTGQALTPEESKALAEYALQREQDFSKGVSTYKQEWENARPVLEALSPFRELIKNSGMNETQWIQGLGQAHHALLTGSADQKLSMFLKLAQDYQVPVQNLFTQGEDGKVYFNPNVQPHQVQQPDPRKIVEDVLNQREAETQLKQFESDPQISSYATPQVKATMAGLLQAGLVQDLKSAFDMAIRFPEHSQIYDSIQQKQRESDEQRRAQEAARTVTNARANVISPKTSTPVGTSTKSTGKGLRSSIEEAFEEHTSRV